MEIGLHRKFLKRFCKLSYTIRLKFLERKELFFHAPFHPLLNNHSVHETYPGWRSINVTGDYRALFEEYGDRIVFMTIGTHSELYS
ncbi:MAG: hypothetical protein UY70_C0005G0012 [Candidatus Kaiserbacteria bacterium GW2011_GWB1_52_6]|uniref:Plasmid stabilization system n=2 Tax=Candidatus Kaiseribacteriota TaxID=1752734 RepID=A0A0G1X9N9_9BACT|nr:MAG: hypothetical protein UY67_C0004G0007 [Candidatus Kaiserbacteria bacterium GW2011_GWA2_52_12]KKW27948.1 MAG: hypothetical protein UY70_C0005G0012 [Candidatus Kaiserbacteria bacterium GW2011_GWB1_52_6]